MASVGDVYIKLKSFSGGLSDIHIDTIPLKVVSASISVSKSIPNMNLPFAGLATGESTNLALDLGMSEKSISINGYILDAELSRGHTTTPLLDSNGNVVVDGDGNTVMTSKTLKFTAMEIAQLIASGVDSTGLAKYQGFDELLLFTESFVDENYEDRGQANDSSISKLGTVSAIVPLSFTSRGEKNSKDNTNIFRPFTYPTANSVNGLRGYISSFNYTLAAESVEVEFSLEFSVSKVIP